MVGEGKVVVNGFGHADYVAFVAVRFEVRADFAHRVHGVVSAVVEKISHVVLAENFQHPFIIRFVLFKRL